MPQEYTDWPHAMVPEPIIKRILDLAGQPGIETVHYFGYADRDLIIALKSIPDLAISLTDYYNRSNHETHFWDEDGLSSYEEYPIPDWFAGTTVHFDGAPLKIHLNLRDVPWDRPAQLQEMIDFKPRKPAKIIALFGKADLATDHPYYEWTREPGITIGFLKEPSAATEQDRGPVA